MPEEKKPWDQDLQAEEKSSGKKPWEQDFEADNTAEKKKSIPLPSESPLLNTASPSTDGAAAFSGKYNFATGENQLPPFQSVPVPANNPPSITKEQAQFIVDQEKGTLPPDPLQPVQITPYQKLKPLRKDGFIDDAVQSLKLPAFNQGFTDIITKPLAGATDFVDRNIDKIYRAVTGDEKTPGWLRKGGAFDKITNHYEDEYAARDEPTGLGGEIAEGLVGTMPLMAAMATGQGEANLLTKAPQAISKITKLFATKEALNSYNDATKDGEGYMQSLGKASEGTLKGGIEGLTLEAQMLVGGALGEKTAKILADNGYFKDNQAVKSVLHALSIGTVFSGSSVGSDLVNGKDIDTHEAAKQFGLGLAFEVPGVIKGLKTELGKKKINTAAAEAASTSSAAENLNSESVLRTLMSLPPDKIEAINKNIPDKHDVLYAKSIEQGAKAYESTDEAEKRHYYSTQLAFKTQGDVKFAADKISENKDEFVKAIEDATDLNEADKALLMDKINLLSEKPVEEMKPESVTTEDPIKETETPVTETGLAQGEKKSEPIELSTEIEPTKSDKVNEDWLKSFEESIKPQETPAETITPKTENNAINTWKIEQSNQPEHSEGSTGGKTETASSSDSAIEGGEKQQEEKVKEKPVQELVDEQEQLEAGEKDDEASVKKLNDDIEVLKKFDKPDIASKKFSAILERAFKMKEEGKISKPTYTAYRNAAQQVLSPKVGKIGSKIDAELAKFKIEILKENIKKKLLGEGYKKVLMSAPGFGPKQVSDLIDLTAKAAQKAIDLGFTVKEAISKALDHIKNHPHYAKLIKEGHLDEEAFTKSVSDTFAEAETPAEETTKKEVTGTAFTSEVGGVKSNRIYLADKEVAKSYGEADNAPLVEYKYKLKNPLVIEGDTDFNPVKKIIDDYLKENPKAKFHPDVTEHVNSELEKFGYDGLIIKNKSLETKQGYKNISGTYGEPQIVVFDRKNIEFNKSDVSGIKKTLVSDEIIQGVDLEKISDKDMQGLAEKLIATGEVKPENIVNEVLIKHRALQPKEVVALIYYKTELDNELRTAYQEKEKLMKDGEPTGAVEANIVNLEQKRTNYDMVSVITAQQQSLAFRLRKGLRDSDFNLVEQIARYKATNNGEMSPEVEAKFREIEKQYKEATEKVAKLEKEAEEREIEDAHRNIIEDIERAKGTEKKKTITQKSKELADKIRKLKGQPLMFTTKDGKEVPIKKQGLGTDAILEIAARTIETTGKVIDGVNAVIKQVKDQDWYKALTKEDKEGFAKQLHERFGEDEKPIARAHVDDDGKLVIPHSLIRSIYESGITDINEIVKEVHKQIEMPEVTERQIRDAITRYGKTVNLNKDEIEAGIRQAKRIGRLISQIEDIQNKERPKRSGLQRDKPSDEERSLMKELKQEMKSLPEDPEEDARAIRSALQAKKARMKNRLADIKEQLRTGIKSVKNSKELELDAEAKELQAELDKLENEVVAKWGKPKLTNEQRVARAINYTEKATSYFKNKIDNKDYSPRKKPEPLLSNSKLTKARGELAEKRDEWEKLQYENELENRSKAEKAAHIMMGVLNIPRAFKLGFDLSAVGVQGLRRLSTSPLQSAKAFKDMMSQTFSEEKQKEWMKTLKGQDIYPKLKAAGSAFTELDGKLSVREENFSNDLVKLAFKKVFNEKLGLNKLNPYEASNRAFSGYLNSIRLQGYLEGFKMLERKGKTFESHPQDYKSWVKYINNITGRGSLGKKGDSSELAQFVFTSPRKMISEANLINPHFWGNVVMKDTGKDYDYQLTPTVARMALTDFALGMGITAVVAALARAAFADKDDKHDKDFYDPRSSNFSGIKIRDEHGGFTMVHPFASYKTEAVLISRILPEILPGPWVGKMTNSRTGKTAPLGKGGNPKGSGLIVSYLENKLSPTVQVAWKKLKQGEKYDAMAEALKTIEPATLEGFLQTYKDYPAATETALTALAFFGISETHIEKKKR